MTSENLRTTAAFTAAAAQQLSEFAITLRQRGHAPLQITQLIQQLLLGFFAQEVGILPQQFLTQLLDAGQQHPLIVTQQLEQALNTLAISDVLSAATGLPLTLADIQLLRTLAELKWSVIEPSIFGTLFERGLDFNQRQQLGAYYTDAAAIMRIVEPLVLAPLRAEWTAIQTTLPQIKSRQATQILFTQLLKRLHNFRVLDPACGSGNFLYLALNGLKDLEYEIILAAEHLHFPRTFPAVGLENVLGIETNAYAAELARITVWIGELQWMIQHGFSLASDRILKPSNSIAHCDALVNENGTEAEWPSVDVIIGNPPFLGGNKKRSILGDDYFSALNRIYTRRIPAGADLVTYWFEKARAQIDSGKAQAAGFVTTSSIRSGANRKVLKRICATTTIFNAWSDETWLNTDAAVRVSLICFGHSQQQPLLNGTPVAHIHADLTADNAEVECDLTQAKTLSNNAGACWRGVAKVGNFDIPGAIARHWLLLPNPQNQPNSDVLTPWVNGNDITRRPTDNWLIDYGNQFSELEAACYEAPFAYLIKHVQAQRAQQRDEKRKRYWWRLGRSGAEIRAALTQHSRYLATPMMGKYRLFMWLNRYIFPDQQLIVIARADDTTFGILHSRFHELWAMRMGSSLGETRRYTPTTTFATFPFPIGLTPADTHGAILRLESGAVIPSVAAEYHTHAIAIAQAAFELNQLREQWLNPPEWIDRVPEVVPGYPERIVAKPEYAAQLKQRTLTKLYNQQPAWLIKAQQQLDCAVAAAYGGINELTETEMLQQLLELNLARSAS